MPIPNFLNTIDYEINLELYVRVRSGKEPEEDEEKGQAANDQMGPNVAG
jgi:hypothetical protein